METKFNIRADPNSPIWGSAQDIKDWLKQWHADGCPTKVEERLVKVKTFTPQRTRRSTKQEQDPYVLITPVLDTDKRDVIIALHYQGRSDAEIAEQVGVAVATVWEMVSQLYVTRKREPMLEGAR